MRVLSAFAIGLIFGLGIMISGMANPAKVINFFDVLGPWDPSLIFVMGGALTVTFIGYRVVFRRPQPIADSRFHLPGTSGIDLRLVGGAAVFGVGWGVAGFCPGGALPALGSGRLEVWLFVAALIVGMLAAEQIQKLAAGGAKRASETKN